MKKYSGEEETMSRYIQVFMTVDKKDAAEKIAATLVEKRLAGCVQIVGPVSSCFQWQGKLELAQEYLCIIKSRQDLFEALEKIVVQMHPYEVPELLAMPVTAGSKGYLHWLEKELEPEPPEWGKDI